MRKGLHGTQGGSHLRPSLDLCLVVGPGADLRRLKAMPPTRASFALSRPISSQPGGRTQLDCVAGLLRIGWPNSATTQTSPCRGRAGDGSGFGSAARRSPWWCARGQASKFRASRSRLALLPAVACSGDQVRGPGPFCSQQTRTRCRTPDVRRQENLHARCVRMSPAQASALSEPTT